MTKAKREKIIQETKERWMKTLMGTQGTASLPEESPRQRAELNAQHAASRIEMALTRAIVVGSTNPRKNFDAAALAELTESVRAHGIIQPPLVRPVPAGRWIVDEGVHHGKKSMVFWQVLDRTLLDGGRYLGPEPVRYTSSDEAEAALPKYELVCGERRLRAATACGLETIPVIVREMSDRDVLEVQVIENLQRADLHPMEEAEGYERLMQSHGYSAEDIAAKVGKDKSYVYKRMKLLALCIDGRTAFYEGRLTASTALVVARIPTTDLQEEALETIDLNSRGMDALSLTEVSDIVRRRFMLDLSAAPFDIKSADLVEGAGPCADCPKRTGNQSELFDDVKSGDVCTDPECFRKKKEAWSGRIVAKAKAKGQTVIDGKEGAALFWGGGGEVRNQAYVNLESKCYEVEKPKSFKALLGKNAPAPILAIDSAGQVHQLLKKDDLAAALKSAGVKLRDSSSLAKHDPEEKARAKQEKARAVLEAKATANAVARAREMVLTALAPSQGLQERAWTALFTGIAALARRDQLESFARNNGIEFVAYQCESTVEKWAREQEAWKLARASMDLACATTVDTFGDEWRDAWVLACEAAGVDLGALVKEEKAKLDGKKKPVAKVPAKDDLNMELLDKLVTLNPANVHFRDALDKANVRTLEEALKDPELSKPAKKAMEMFLAELRKASA